MPRASLCLHRRLGIRRLHRRGRRGEGSRLPLPSLRGEPTLTFVGNGRSSNRSFPIPPRYLPPPTSGPAFLLPLSTGHGRVDRSCRLCEVRLAGIPRSSDNFATLLCRIHYRFIHPCSNMNASSGPPGRDKPFTGRVERAARCRISTPGHDRNPTNRTDLVVCRSQAE